jgi:AraC-like DNA-binding protein
MSQTLLHLIITHLHDLFAASALNLNSRAARTRQKRGKRAERLLAIKSDIAKNLYSPDLTITAVAWRQRISARYLHKLFAMEGRTFSEFVVSQRLSRAYDLLTSSHHARLKISTIAFECGFGDLSYFNRRFRRYFGATPGALRDKFLKAITHVG